MIKSGMNLHPNLNAYGDVENLSRFNSNSFKTYCKNKLDDCESDLSFIKNLIISTIN